MILCSALFSASLVCPVGRADEKSTAANFQYVMSGMKAHRDMLRTGTFSVAGIVTDSDNTHGTLRGTVNIYSSFDHPGGRLRFDRRAPYRGDAGATSSANQPDPTGSNVFAEKSAKTPSGKPVVNPNWRPMLRYTQYAKTPKGDVAHHVGGETVVLRDPRSAKYVGEPFDARSIGLQTYAAYSTYKPFDAVWTMWSRYRPKAVDKIDGNVWKVLIEDDELQIQLFVDEGAGFSPVRLEFRTWEAARTVPPSGKWSEPKILSLTTWEKVNDVFVPRSFEMTTTMVPSNPIEYKYAFAWSAVNQPVDDKEFTYEGFAIKERATVLEKVPGQRKAAVVEVLNNPDDAFQPPKRVGGRSQLYKAIGLSFVCFAVVTTVTYLYRYRRRHTATSAPVPGRPAGAT